MNWPAKMRPRAPSARRSSSISGDENGATAVEFALVLLVTALLLFGIIKFGLVLNNQIQLTHAASAAARQLSISRGSATPYSSTIAAMRNAAPTLKSTDITTTLTVGGAACTGDDQTCRDAFGTGTTTVQAQAVLRYPCNLNVLFIRVANCSFGTTAAAFVQ